MTTLARGEPSAGLQLCVFRVGDEEYAVDIMRVDEILFPPPVTPVPSASKYVPGIINLRGMAVPVVDLRVRLGAGQPRPDSKPRLVVCFLGRRRVGLQVDAVVEMARIRRDQIQPAPAQAGVGGEPCVAGVYEAGGRLRLLLHLRGVLLPASVNS